MWRVALQISQILFSRAFLIGLVIVISCTFTALYLWAVDSIETLERERARLEVTIAETQSQIAYLQQEAEAAAREATASARRFQEINAQLQAQLDHWARLRSWLGWADPQIDALRQTELEAARQQARAERSAATARAQLAGLLALQEDWRLALENVNGQLQPWRDVRDGVAGYFGRAFVLLRDHLLLVAVLIMAGPTLWKLWLFHFWAPRVIRWAGELHFGAAPGAAPPAPIVAETVPTLEEVAEAEAGAISSPIAPAASLQLGLPAGSEALVRNDWLRATDDRLRQRSTLLYDWRQPALSLAAGLSELARLSPAPEATGEPTVTIAPHDERQCDLVVLDLAAGAGLVLRPTTVVAIVYPTDQRPALRRHWRWDFQAWALLRFRYFELVGPARVILAGRRGLRLEPVTLGAPRRTAQGSALAQSATLRRSLARADSVWAYWRGHRPLLDERFTGTGLLVAEEPLTPQAKRGQAFWPRLWDGVLKLVGI